MWKRLIIAFLIVTFLFTMISLPNAMARHRRHTQRALTGAAIFLGTAFLIDAFVRSNVPRYCPTPPPPPRCTYQTGHWEWRDVWVPPERERVWIEGHYDRYGCWVPGHWKVIYKPGYWAKKRIWVSDCPY